MFEHGGKGVDRDTHLINEIDFRMDDEIVYRVKVVDLVAVHHTLRFHYLWFKLESLLLLRVVRHLLDETVVSVEALHVSVFGRADGSNEPVIEVRDVLQESVLQLREEYFLGGMNISEEITESVNHVGCFRREVEHLIILQKNVKKILNGIIVLRPLVKHLLSLVSPKFEDST